MDNPGFYLSFIVVLVMVKPVSNSQDYHWFLSA